MNIAIVGAGISGLTTAYYLQNFADVTLFEKERIGGKAQTFKKEEFLFEEGVNGFLSSGIDALELAEDIGVQLIKANENSKIRYIYDDKLYKLPSKPQEFIFSDILSFSAKLRVAQEFFIKQKKDDTDESVYQFALRRFGKEFADRFMVPMVAGIYASTPQNLSLKSAFPKIYNLEKEYGGLFRGMLKLKKGGAPAGELMSCEFGISEYIEKLYDNLNIKFENREIESIDELGEFDKIILATPSYDSAKILKKYERLSQYLKEIKYNPVVVLGFNGDVEPVSFGILTTKLKTLGILFDKFIFPNRNGFRVMVGGDRFRNIVELSDDEIVKMVIDDIEKVIGKRDIKLEFIKRWEKAIPNYSLGHSKIVENIRQERIENLYLNSGAYEGVSFSDRIKYSKLLAESIKNENS